MAIWQELIPKGLELKGKENLAEGSLVIVTENGDWIWEGEENLERLAHRLIPSWIEFFNQRQEINDEPANGD